MTETTTASREPTDAELPVTETTVTKTTDAAPETPPQPAPVTLETAAPDPEVIQPEVTPSQAEAAPSEDNNREYREEDDEATEEDDAPPSLIPIAEGPPPEPTRPLFSDLGLSAEVLRAIDDMGYRHPTPIQEQAIPYVLMGRDVMGTAQTGTGKTAGFTLPMLDILSGSRARARMPRSLILEPTRELALQVAENFVEYGKYLKLTHALIIGGESMSDQKDVLNRGVDVLIATPGRLLDMFDRGTILLTDTKLLVIDEADRMLDMGFIPDVERIVAMLPNSAADPVLLRHHGSGDPPPRRCLSAKSRRKSRFRARPRSPLRSPRAWRWSPNTISGRHLRRLIRSQNVQNALIFCNRKRDVDILHKSLTKHHFDAGALHGDMAQTVRFSTLEKFKANELRLLVCSDVAARGLDIGGLSHVFNFDVPIHAEDYVHRIGRTGRAGLEGKALTIAAPDDRYAVEQIEKLIHHPIPPILVEGLDPVDWAEKDGRKRRGRKAAAPKKAAEKKPRETREKVERPRTERSRPERKRPERPAQRELPVLAEERRPRREEARRPEPRREEPRRDERARDELRLDEPRRDDFRRERYRRDDDLGPAVVGFGDDVPAFMFLRTRSSPMGENRETDA